MSSIILDVKIHCNKDTSSPLVTLSSKLHYEILSIATKSEIHCLKLSAVNIAHGEFSVTQLGFSFVVH